MINRKLNSQFYDKSVVVETILLILSISVTILCFVSLDITEKIFEFMAQHEELELDEIINILAVSSIFLFIFTLRRFFHLKKLLIIAWTDPLIGLINRRKGIEYIDKEIQKITKSMGYSSLIMYDIDDFKKINDTFGHDSGDKVLMMVSEIIEKNMRSEDFNIRWGGEEFIICCPNTQLKEAVLLAERFRKNIENYIFPNEIKITISLGVIELKAGESIQEQIIRADKELYKSKNTGKNKVSSS